MPAIDDLLGGQLLGALVSSRLGGEVGDQGGGHGAAKLTGPVPYLLADPVATLLGHPTGQMVRSGSTSGCRDGTGTVKPSGCTGA
jgi:hypothetical protein